MESMYCLIFLKKATSHFQEEREIKNEIAMLWLGITAADGFTWCSPIPAFPPFASKARYSLDWKPSIFFCESPQSNQGCTPKLSIFKAVTSGTVSAYPTHSTAGYLLRESMLMGISKRILQMTDVIISTRASWNYAVNW